jgi:hypothetical protein
LVFNNEAFASQLLLTEFSDVSVANIIGDLVVSQSIAGALVELCEHRQDRLGPMS